MDRAKCIIVLVVKVCIVDIAFNRLQQIEGDLSTIWIVYEARNGVFLFFSSPFVELQCLKLWANKMSLLLYEN